MELSSNQHKLYQFLKSRSQDGGKTTQVTYAEMAEYMGVKAGMPTTINALIAKGYLTRDFPEIARDGITYTFIK